MYSRLVVTILGLLITSEAAPDLGHGDHAAHNNAILDSEDVVDPSADGTTAEGYYNYNNYYQDQAAYNNYYYGDQYAEQGAQSSELVAKQEDGGLFSSVDRIFFGGQGLALPLAITLFLVDIVISAAFLLFPVTFEVEADNRRSWRSDDWSLSSRKRSKKRRNQRSVPAPLSLCSEEVAASEGVAGQMCSLMSAAISSVDCLEVARCEVSQLTESPSFPTMAAMVRPFVPSEVIASFRDVDCSSVKCSKRNKFSWDQNNI